MHLRWASCWFLVFCGSVFSVTFQPWIHRRKTTYLGIIRNDIQNDGPGRFGKRDTLVYFPEHQLRCIGKVPAQWQTLYLPNNDVLSADSRSNYEHPRKLCALTQYGGSSIFNAGGRCSPPAGPNSDHFNGQFVVEDRFADGKIDHAILWEILEFCRLRCRCVNPVTADNSRPAEEIVESEAQPPAPYDRNDPGNSQRMGPPSPNGGITLIQIIPVVLPYGSSEKKIPKALSLSLNRQKYIAPKCDGLLPHWRLPHPFDTQRSFSNMHQLCAAQGFGGSSDGNAGMVCRKFDETLMLMAEEFLAHPALSRNNEREESLGLAVEVWCQRFCYCPQHKNDEGPEPVEQIPVYGFDQGQPISALFPPSGSVVLRSTLPSGKKFSSIISAPGSSPFACQLGLKDKCSPTILMLQTQRLKPFTKTPAPVCGGSCTKWSDCASDASTSCRCVAQIESSPMRIIDNNQNSLKFLTLCSSIVLTMSVPRTRQPRAVEGHPLCACNSTFVSSGCCYAPDGLI